MKKTNRTYEFSKMYYDWVCKCLTEDEKFEELLFFKLGVDLMVRQKELMSIKYSQIEFPYLKNIQVFKINPNMSQPTYYQPREISRDTYDLLNVVCDKDKDKIFDKPTQRYVRSIIKSIGDGNFNALYLRKLGMIMKCNELKEKQKKRSNK